jgi:hypothetical protein
MSNTITNINEPKGLLEIYGPISFEQFYYQDGDSDADTVKIKVKVDSVRLLANNTINNFWYHLGSDFVSQQYSHSKR